MAHRTPPADPATVRALLTEIGMLPRHAGDAQVRATLRRFQWRAGLRVDGVAGARTCQAPARYASEARELHALGLAA